MQSRHVSSYSSCTFLQTLARRSQSRGKQALSCNGVSIQGRELASGTFCDGKSVTSIAKLGCLELELGPRVPGGLADYVELRHCRLSQFIDLSSALPAASAAASRSGYTIFDSLDGVRQCLRSIGLAVPSSHGSACSTTGAFQVRPCHSPVHARGRGHRDRARHPRRRSGGRPQIRPRMHLSGRCW